jgi:hypothetical protein
MRTLAALALVAIIAAAPSARAEVESGFYAGVSVGHSRLEIGDQEFSVEASDLSHRIFGGYDFGPYFALEGEYFNGGALARTPRIRSHRGERPGLQHAVRERALSVLGPV